MEVKVWSIPKTAEHPQRWPREDEICPLCNKPFGTGKMVRVDKAGKLSDNGRVVHKRCASCAAWSAVAAQLAD